MSAERDVLWIKGCLVFMALWVVGAGGLIVWIAISWIVNGHMP